MMNVRFLKFGTGIIFGVLISVSFVYAATPLRIRYTKHNLSNWGPGNVKAVTETEVCKFCHAPHNADSQQVPLWGHADQDPSVTFTMASTTHVAKNHAGVDNEPSGISKKCLSCHDGTVAIGSLANGTIAVTGANGAAPDILGGTRGLSGGLHSPPTTPDSGYIGTDLRGGHVISFNYKTVVDSFDAGHVNYVGWDGANPPYISNSDKASMFDRQGRMQCHSCHDPHTDWCDDTSHTIGGDPLWRKACDNVSTYNDAVCKVCHRTTPGPGFRKYSF